MRQKMVAGNWKMNGTSNSVRELVSGIKAGLNGQSAEVVVCPSFVYLPTVAAEIAGSAITILFSDRLALFYFTIGSRFFSAD